MEQGRRTGRDCVSVRLNEVEYTHEGNSFCYKGAGKSEAAAAGKVIQKSWPCCHEENLQCVFSLCPWEVLLASSASGLGL